jgi:cobalamin biosynthesis Mg chelatase CobN
LLESIEAHAADETAVQIRPSESDLADTVHDSNPSFADTVLDDSRASLGAAISSAARTTSPAASPTRRSTPMRVGFMLVGVLLVVSVAGAIAFALAR